MAAAQRDRRSSQLPARFGPSSVPTLTGGRYLRGSRWIYVLEHILVTGSSSAKHDRWMAETTHADLLMRLESVVRDCFFGGRSTWFADGHRYSLSICVLHTP